MKRINILRTRELPFLMKSMRRASGLTQDEVAKLCGVTRQTISEWEVAKRSPNPHNFVKWMRALKEHST